MKLPMNGRNATKPTSHEAAEPAMPSAPATAF